jgi:hypothetical protein
LTERKTPQVIRICHNSYDFLSAAVSPITFTPIVGDTCLYDPIDHLWSSFSLTALLVQCCQLAPTVHQSIPPFILKIFAETMTFIRKRSVLGLEGEQDQLYFGPYLTITGSFQLRQELISYNLVRVFMASHRAAPVGGELLA